MIVGPLPTGRYEIERHLASGGMAEVYLALDPPTGRRVALKIPHDGEEIWEAERAGAGLQVELSKRDPRVPAVLEIGDGAARFVAMEYVEGEDLARRLESGPLDWREAAAIAIELCGVLATARSCTAPSGEPGGIVHGDIKPRNVRLMPDGSIKVLDFGIARALRDSRAATRNPYASAPYSSPERLEHGVVDYHSDLWSVAVVLYEMLEGRRPFQSPGGDAGLERLLRSGARPAPLTRDVPAGFGAILGRALAHDLADRYASAGELAQDLAAIRDGREPVFAARFADAAATRRTTRGAAEDAAATRRTAADPAATRRTTPAAGNGAAHAVPTNGAHGRAAGPAVLGTPAPPRARAAYAEARETADLAPPPPRPRPALGAALRRVPWPLLAAAVAVVLLVRDIQGFAAGRELRAGLASRPRGEAMVVWNEYRRVMRGRALVHLSGATAAVREWMVSHADDLISRYRSDTPTLYESGWRAAEALLLRAAQLDPGNRRIQARLELCRAHLLRIAARDAADGDESMSRYDEALSRFERAARLWPSWGDPHIGAAQIHAYGKRDPERTAESLELAREAGYPFGEREAALLGDAHRLRAERRRTASTEGFDTDQQIRHWERIREDCALALEQYERVPSYAGVPRHVRTLRQRLAAADARLATLRDERDRARWRALFGLGS